MNYSVNLSGGDTGNNSFAARLQSQRGKPSGFTQLLNLGGSFHDYHDLDPQSFQYGTGGVFNATFAGHY